MKSLMIKRLRQQQRHQSVGCHHRLCLAVVQRTVRRMSLSARLMMLLVLITQHGVTQSSTTNIGKYRQLLHWLPRHRCLTPFRLYQKQKVLTYFGYFCGCCCSVFFVNYAHTCTTRIIIQTVSTVTRCKRSQMVPISPSMANTIQMHFLKLNNKCEKLVKSYENN